VSQHDMNQYRKLGICFLPAGIELVSDLFLYMPANQHLVRLLKRGDKVSTENYLQLAKATDERIFVSREDYARFIDAFSGHVALKAAADTKDPVVMEMVASLMRGIKCDNTSPVPNHAKVRQALDDATELVTNIISKFKHPSAEAFMAMLKSMDKSENPVERHNIYVSALTVMGLISLGGTDMAELADASLAGLTHDIGLSTMSKQIVDKHLNGLNDFTKQERLIYVRHAEMSADILKASVHNVSDGAVRIVEHHHENWNGSGLKGVEGNKIYRPARMLRIMDDLVTKIDRLYLPVEMERAIAMLEMENASAMEGGSYDPEMFQRLKETILKT
jgi:HD-GYP domain-containing protein (c-di-GMP phosphodiesterase class II)